MRRFLNSKIVLACLVAAVVLAGMSVGRVVLENRSLAREIAALEAEAATLEAKNLELGGLVKRLQGSGFLEREARLKLGLQKPGEELLLVRRSAVATATPGAAAAEASNLDRWWRYFFVPAAEASAL